MGTSVYNYIYETVACNNCVGDCVYGAYRHFWKKGHWLQTLEEMEWLLTNKHYTLVIKFPWSWICGISQQTGTEKKRMHSRPLAKPMNTVCAATFNVGAYMYIHLHTYKMLYYAHNVFILYMHKHKRCLCQDCKIHTLISWSTL